MPPGHLSRTPQQAPNTNDPLVGRLVAGKYRVQSLLAEGGMGRIYRAEQLPLGRAVALKVLSLRHVSEDDPEFTRRFLLEAETLARLRHPNTVTVYDYGQLPDGEGFYIVMELIIGRTLNHALGDEGPMEPLRALKITYEIARSLREAHELGMVHRDLKPSNVMLVDTEEGESIKVLDFGIVKVLSDEDSDITRHDRIVGSPGYMSPEQIRQLHVDHRSDIYSLGVLLFQMLTGVPPFRRPTRMATYIAHVQDPVPRIAEVSSRPVPPDIEAVVRRCLAKDPADRFVDVDALRLQIRELLLQSGAFDHWNPSFQGSSGRHPAPVPSPTPKPEPTVEVPRAVPAPRARVSTGVAAAGIAAAVLVAWLVGRWSQPVAAEVMEPTARTMALVTAPGVLQVISEPEGVQVWEGSQLVGTTPVSLQLAARPDAPPRVFELRAHGYHPYRFVQGPSSGEVTVRASLVPLD